MSEFSINLKKAIELSGHSIYSIAKEINYDRATLTNQINGHRKMTKDVFLKLLNTLNITESSKQNLIDLFHKDIFEYDYETFKTIKESFLIYNKISAFKENIDISVSHTAKLPTDTIFSIDGELNITNNIKSIVAKELTEENPLIYFNLDLTKSELLLIIRSAYLSNSESKNIKNIISFSINKSDRLNNFQKFIKILPLLLNGYCPYYYYSGSNTESELSVLFPYYLITKNHIIFISSDFNRAIISSDKSSVEGFKNEFELKLEKCKKFKFESAAFFDMPFVFSKSLDTQDESAIYCLNENFCALPFLTREHLEYMFSDKLENLNVLICELNKCYKKMNGYIAFTPVESIREFVKTGRESHTNNDYSRPLTVSQRIKVLSSIRSFINSGGNYFFIKRDDFFCKSLTFNVMSDSKIVFFSFENTDKNSMYILTTPNGLLNELKNFFKALKKSCYVLSAEESIKAIDKGIEYAKNMLNN